jgi:acyl carrier protein
VLDEIRGMLLVVLGEYAMDDIEITPDLSLTDDLGLESIDLVTIAGLLTERYGERVNLAAHLAEMDIDDVIRLRVGGLVDFVVGSLATPAEH